MTAPIINESTTQIYSVSDLNRTSRALLEGELGYLWIKGELASVSHPSSGHVYFTLKDKNASIRAALFRMQRRKVAFPIENGIEVLVYAKVSLYEPRGDYQLIVSAMEEVGSGLLARQFELLKMKLEKAGLFAKEHKKPIPKSPSTIGVITSSSGAALRDVLRVLQRRSPATKVIIYPTLVQGKSAGSAIAKMVALANKRQECDVLLVTRGGGSQEDLWCFNDEGLAKAIFDSELPVVSAVGHEVDFTIADFVADLRVATPSAGAELLSADNKSTVSQIKQLKTRLINAIESALNEARWQVEHLKNRLPSPIHELQEQAQKLDHLEFRIKAAMNNTLQYKKQKIQQLSRHLNALSPLATLDRGYALVEQNNQILSSVKQLDKKQPITIQMHDGKVQASPHE